MERIHGCNSWYQIVHSQENMLKVLLIKKKTKGLGKKEQLLLQPIMSYTLESHNTIQTWLRY